MYKDVVKRIIAFLLIFCMIGTMQDYSPLAKEITGEEGTQHTYQDSMGAVEPHTLENGQYFANAFTVSANDDTTKNAQVLKSVSFALDAKLQNGADITNYVNTADYTVKVFKYTNSPMDVIAGTPDASVSGTYKKDDLGADNEYVTVNFDANAAYSSGDSFLAFSSGEKYVVQVEVTNAAVYNGGGTAEPASTPFHIKTAVSADSISYVNGTELAGKTVCIQAVTAEAFVEEPLTGIEFTESGIDLMVGDKKTAIGVNYLPAGAPQKTLKWTSSNPAVASVDENTGEITALSKGAADITASVEDLGIFATTTLTVSKDIENDLTIDVSTIEPQPYTSGQLKPEFSVKDADEPDNLVVDTHYKVNWGANKNAGKDAGTVTIIGLGNGYLGERTEHFDILPVAMNDSGLSVELKDPDDPKFIFGGNAVTLTGDDLIVKFGTDTLAVNTDYKIKEHGNNTVAGNNAYVILEGVAGSNYTGERTVNFGIKKSINDPSITVSLNNKAVENYSVIYSGAEQKPAVSLTDTSNPAPAPNMKNEHDYKVKWDGKQGTEDGDFTSAGIKQFTITGVGAYETENNDEPPVQEKRVVTYEITRRSIKSGGVKISNIPSQIIGTDEVTGVSLSYNGKPLVKGTDYTVLREDNLAARTTKITIEGILNYQDKVIFEDVPTGIDISKDTGGDPSDVRLISDFTYTGGEIIPIVEVRIDGSLVDDEFYDVAVENNTNACADTEANAPFVRITGKGRYAGEITKKFTINQKDIGTLDASAFSYEDMEFVKTAAPQAAIKTPLSITYGKVLKEGLNADYIAIYSDCYSATDERTPAKITVTGHGNFKGSTILQYQIKRMEIPKLTFRIDNMPYTDSISYPYTGEPIKPEVRVFQNNVELERDVDYKLQYGTNTNVSTTDAYVMVVATNRGETIGSKTGSGNYQLNKTLSFKIEKYDLSAVTVSNIKPQGYDYTGEQVKPFEESNPPVVSVPGSSKSLKFGDDYDVTYKENIEAGIATAALHGKGINFTGDKFVTFKIVKDIRTAFEGTIKSIKVDDIDNQKYAGVAIEPLPKVTDIRLSDPDKTSYEMLWHTDYELSWEANDHAGDAVIVITGKDCYTGEIRKPFKIIAGSLSDAGIAVSLVPMDMTFTGSPVEPDVVVTYNGRTLQKGINKDYTISHDNAVNVDDDSKVMIEGAKNFEGTKPFSYDITQKNLGGSDITIKLLGGAGSGNDEFDYTGSAVKPKVEITDTSRAADTGEKVTAGTGGYKLSSLDYTVKYDNRSEVSDEVPILISGRRNYYTSEPIKITFKIKQVELTGLNTSMDLAKSSYTYTGKPIEPFPVVTYTNGAGDSIELNQTTDFVVETLINGTVGEAKNVADGTIKYRIRGVGGYRGLVDARADDTFTITPRSIGPDSLDIIVQPIPNQAYTGAQVTPKVKIEYQGITLNEQLAVGDNGDYSLSYGTNIDMDDDNTPLDRQASVTITGQGNFRDSRIEHFHIRSGMEKVSVSLASNKYTYTSEPIEPQPIVTSNGVPLKIGKDYTLDYAYNTDASKYAAVGKKPTVIVQGEGSYGGKKVLEFSIETVNMADKTVPIRLEVRSAEFTGSTVKPDYDLIYSPSTSGDPINYKLKIPTDYQQESVTGKDVKDKGTIVALPYGSRGNFEGGRVSYKFDITAKDITDNPDIEVAIEDPVFTGSAVDPVVTITDKMRKSGSGESQETNPDGSVYTLKPEDYEITYTPTDLVGPGEVTAHIEGRGNYQGTIDKTFKIKGVFSNAEVSLGEAVYAGGDPVEPSITVTYNNGAIILDPKTDYEYKFYDNEKCSDRAYVIVKGKNSYAGDADTDKRIDFEIKQKDIKKGIEEIKDMKLTGVGPSYTYDGEPIKPIPSIKYGKHDLVEDIDYTCTYDPDCIDVGSYKVVIAAKPGGNYTGSITREYLIGSNFNVKVALENDSYVYTRGEIRPRVTVTDIDTDETLEDSDYVVEYDKNTNVGTATIDVYGNGEKYQGNTSTTFKITPKSLKDDDIQIADIGPEIYSGSAFRPEPIVRWNQGGAEEKETLGSTDFVYTYGDNIKAGSKAGSVTIMPAKNSNYTNSKTVYFDIERKDISLEDSGITVEAIDTQYYAPGGIRPKPVVKWGDILLEEGAVKGDYSLAYSENDHVGKATVTIKGENNYKGEIPVDFEIEKRPLDSMTIEYQDEWQYTGDDIYPELNISFLDNDKKTVQLGEGDYTVGYDANKNAGKGTIKITADEVNYTGDITKYFTILPRDIGKDATISMSEVLSQVLNSEGKAEPEPVLTFSPNGANGKKYILEKGEDKDYILGYENNTTAGQTGTVTVYANDDGNYTGTRSATFYIGDDVTKYIDASITDDISNLVYNGKEQKPKVTVTKIGSLDLIENEDYQIIYDTDCTSAGEHKVSVKGLPPYGGSIDMTYTIAKREISNVKFDITSQIFNGSSIHPQIIGIDNEATTVLGEDSSTAAVIGDIDIEGMHTNKDAFTTSITDNVNNGEAKVSITATDYVNSNYTGTTTASFTIARKDVASDTISSTKPLDQIYTGSPLYSELVLTDTGRNKDGSAKGEPGGDDYILKEHEDYEVISTENTYPGIAFMNVEGRGNYINSITKTFTITADLSNAVIHAIPEQAYTGGAVCPELTVTLGERKLTKLFDYSVEYKENINRGTATAIISQGENKLYTGSKSINFIISRDISLAKVTMINSSYTYTGEAITPAVAVEYDAQRLEYGKDYAVAYSDNINVGTATITITGIGAYSGVISGNFNIEKKSIIRCDFNDLMPQSYTGTPTIQTIYVSDGMSMLMESRDYTVNYVNNTSPGTATITIMGTGNYGGVKTIRYNIEVPNMSSVSGKASTSSIKLSWNQVGGITGYEIYDTKNRRIAKTSSNTYTKKKLKKLTTYSYKVRPYVTADGATYFGGFSNVLSVTTVPSKPSVKLSAGSKSIKVTWKKIKGVSGYQVYCSTSKKGTYKRIKTITKSSTISYTNKKLKSRKTYYYKVRAYKTVKGKKVYSSYSSIKSTRAK